jgi:2-octaprenyl-6-methoxyphenol hydroxylase
MSKQLVVIQGAGPVGLALACGLLPLGYEVVVLDRYDPADVQVVATADNLGARSLALNAASLEILQALKIDAQAHPETCALMAVDVREKGHNNRAWIDTLHLQRPVLGAVVHASWLQKQLIERALSLGVQWIKASVQQVINKSGGVELTLTNQTVLQTPLLVVADGTQSQLLKDLQFECSQKALGQAIYVNLEGAKAHQGRSLELFLGRDGVLGLLPFAGSNRASLVWCGSDQAASDLFARPLEAQVAQFQAWIGNEPLGQFRALAPSIRYPLFFHHCAWPIRPHTVVVGNAAHTLHPIAGQGLNLALQDIAALLQQAKGEGPWWPKLQAYHAIRSPAQAKVMQACDLLLRICAQDQWGMNILRKTGLSVFNRIPMLPKALGRRAMGFDL